MVVALPVDHEVASGDGRCGILGIIERIAPDGLNMLGPATSVLRLRQAVSIPALNSEPPSAWAVSMAHGAANTGFPRKRAALAAMPVSQREWRSMAVKRPACNATDRSSAVACRRRHSRSKRFRVFGSDSVNRRDAITVFLITRSGGPRTCIRPLCSPSRPWQTMENPDRQDRIHTLDRRIFRPGRALIPAVQARRSGGSKSPMRVRWQRSRGLATVSSRADWNRPRRRRLFLWHFGCLMKCAAIQRIRAYHEVHPFLACGTP